MGLYNGVIQYIVNIYLELKKGTIRVITNSEIRVFCWELFKKLQILIFYSQYIYSLLMFAVNSRDLFKLNSDIHNIGSRHNSDFHLPSAQSKLFQKGVFFLFMN
jgi:hypothetical protein